MTAAKAGELQTKEAEFTKEKDEITVSPFYTTLTAEYVEGVTGFIDYCSGRSRESQRSTGAINHERI